MPESILNSLNRIVPVSRETFGRLELYVELLTKWQSKINLIGPDTVGDIWHRHIEDSLQILPLIDPKKTIIDMGTGAGFPGMVLAILGCDHLHLIESDSRKIAFLKEVARITHVKPSFHNQRIEMVEPIKGDYIVSRALSSLSSRLDLSRHFVSHETICLFHKGRNYSNEIEEAEKNWSFDYEIFPSIIDKQGIILKLSNIRRRG